MHRRIEIAQVDAFTQTRFTGNPATVVLDADQLSEDEVRALAREVGHGDTAFVLPPDGADHDLRLRFFTPRGETGFIGHATLAAHTALSRRALQPRSVQKQKSGLVEIEVRSEGGDDAYVTFRQPAPTLGRLLDPSECERVIAALGFAASDRDERCPIQVVGGTSTRLLIGIDESASLAGAAPDLARLTTLSPQIGAAGYFLFTLSPGEPGCRTEARMFCPALGIDEDPVSGNAHGMLATYLHAQGLLGEDELRAGFVAAQGHHMGRPGRLDVHAEVSAGAVTSTRIGGHAVMVFEAVIDLPG